jgi:cell division topological specificity factor
VEFLRKLFGGGGSSSAQEARDRLRLVIMHDRTDISPQLLENLRMEMIAVLTKYMDIDESKIEMNLGHDKSAVALVANIPVLRIKRGAGDVLGNNGAEKIPPRGEPLPSGNTGSINNNTRNRRRR